MAHLQYIPGDPRLVDQLVYELKSKGIFDQFRKDCIADVDTRPAYQNLRQRVENSVSTFLARQCWQPDLNKNQLREKLRKHILDGNYLEQGVERIVDQVVNPKVASVFIPQVEDLVYNYLGITRKKTVSVPETSNGKVGENNLLPTDLEAVSPGSVDDDRNEEIEDLEPPGVDSKMDIDHEDTYKQEMKHDDSTNDTISKIKADSQESQMSVVSEPISVDSNSSIDKSYIPLPDEEIKLENIPVPENSPPKASKVKVELEKIKLPEELNVSTDIPLPEESFKCDKDHYFKPVNSDDSDSSSDSSLRRNMSPLTPIRNFNNENSCDAQQAFDDDSVDSKTEKFASAEPNSFRFTIKSKDENSSEITKSEKKDTEQANLSYQFNSQVNINAFNTPMYDDSSNSNLLHIDYESDANSKLNIDNKTSEPDQNSNETRKDKRQEDKKTTHRSSHHKDSHRHTTSRDKRSESKQSSTRDSRSDKKSSKDDHKGSSKSTHKARSGDRSDKKDGKEPTKHRSSHKSSSSHKDSKSHRSSSSSQRHSSSKHSDEKKSSSSHRDKEKSSKDDKHSKEKSSKVLKSSSSSHKAEKDRKSTSSSKSKHDEKDKKKDKKETDDHYSASGRGSHSRRSTDRDSNDGSSSSKGSQNPSSRKSSDSKKESKSSISKSDTTSTSGDSTSPSDKDLLINDMNQLKSGNIPGNKPIIRVDNRLEIPIHSPRQLGFLPDVTLKKPKIAANLKEARKLMKMRKFLDEEQKRMNQEAALLLEFQANVRPSMSQVYSSISGPELEFACVATTSSKMIIGEPHMLSGNNIIKFDNIEPRNESISDILNAAEQVESIEENKHIQSEEEKRLAVIVEQIETDIIDQEIDEETSQTDNATVRVEESMVTDENIIQHIPVDDKNDKILYILSKTNEDKILDSETVYTDILTNIVVDADTIMEVKTRNEKQATENVDKIEADEIEMKLSLLHEKKHPDTNLGTSDKMHEIAEICEETPLQYFGEHEKYKAELERDTFSKFLNTFTKKCTKKMYLLNCNTYEEKIMKEVLQNLGVYEVVNYHKNGHLKRNKTAKNVVRNVNVSTEISLPVDRATIMSPSPSVFSPLKSDCSFDLSSDYDAKLEEMVSKTSRREIMEIIIGNVAEESTDTELPTIDYCSELNIVSDSENTVKRKYCEVESSENNNRQVLTPNKIRKLSESDQITSTTGESVETSNNNVSTNNSSMRSKYLGRARRVGLPRPRRSNVANSPSSDKSVENYEQNTPVTQTPNGKIKTPRIKIQRYDTSELYKPKLHYLSRRNNVS